MNNKFFITLKFLFISLVLSACGDADDTSTLELLVQKNMVELGVKAAYTVVLNKENGVKEDVTQHSLVTSLVDSIATAESGVIVTYSKGETSLVANYKNKKSNVVEFKVINRNLERIQISSQLERVYKNEITELTAIGTFSDGSILDVTDSTVFQLISIEDEEVFQLVGSTLRIEELGAFEVSAKFDNISSDNELFISVIPLPERENVLSVTAVRETDPVSNVGDAADDAAFIYTENSFSDGIVVGTDKLFGFELYNLKGNKLYSKKVGRINNVDTVSVLEGDEIVDIIIGSNRSNDLISIYYFNDNKAEMMSEVKTLDSNSHVNSWLNGIYGLCAITEGNSIFVSASNKDGMVNLLKIKSNGEEYSSELLFSFEFTSIIEGCVFSSNGFLYIAEENVGIWSINLDSFNVVPVLSLGEFSTVADLEGLTVFNYNGLTYLVVSSQGNSTFNVISVTSQPHHMGTFQIIDGNGIDKVTGADGIHLAYELSNEDFPLGVFIAQDNENEGNQNFKLVNWLYIVDVMKLINDE